MAFFQIPVNHANSGDDSAFVNQRQFFRILFSNALSADMTIIQIKGKVVELGKTEVVIEDMGIGGLRFLAIVKLPVNREIAIEFITQILGRKLRLQGVIAWCQVVNEHICRYGIEFLIAEQEQAALTRLLNEVALYLRQNRPVPKSRWIQTDKIEYLNQYQNMARLKE